VHLEPPLKMTSSESLPGVYTPYPVPSEPALDQESLNPNDSVIIVESETESTAPSSIQFEPVSEAEGTSSDHSGDMGRRTPPLFTPKVRSDTLKSQSSHSSSRRDSVEYESGKSRTR
jgi:hypothetical protein